MISVELPINMPGGLPVDIHVTFKQALIVSCIVLAGLAIVRFGFMHYATAGIGEEVVLIDSPWLFGSSGVRDEPLKFGRKTVFNSTSEVRVGVLPEPHTVEFNNLLTRNNTKVNVRFNVQLQITDSPAVIGRFGVNWYKTTIEPQFLQLTQSVIRKVSMDEISAGTSSKAIEGNLRDAIIDMIADVGVSVMLTSITLEKIDIIAPISVGTPIKPK